MIMETVMNAEATNLLDLVVREGERADLIFMDPPFNVGEPYDGWNDSLPETSFRGHVMDWLTRAEAALRTGGSLWLNLPDHMATYVPAFAERLDLSLQNWCIWHYRFAVCNNRKGFLRSKTHALWYTKGPLRTFNAKYAKVPSLRATVYNDWRIMDKPGGGFRRDFDVWGFDKYWGRVQGNSDERRPLHPNQLPEVYLERVIGVCTRPGDLVVDPFGGSGTTAVVAKAMGRSFYTGDISARTCESIVQRLKEGAVRIPSVEGDDEYQD